jgi:hypothetical protein
MAISEVTTEQRREIAEHLRYLADRLEEDQTRVAKAEAHYSRPVKEVLMMGQDRPAIIAEAVTAEVHVIASWPVPEPEPDYEEEARAAHTFLDRVSIKAGPLQDRIAELLDDLFGEWVKEHLTRKLAGGGALEAEDLHNAGDYLTWEEEARAAHTFLDRVSIKEGPLQDRIAELLDDLFGEWVKEHLTRKLAGGGGLWKPRIYTTRGTT